MFFLFLTKCMHKLGQEKECCTFLKLLMKSSVMNSLHSQAQTILQANQSPLTSPIWLLLWLVVDSCVLIFDRVCTSMIEGM